MEEWQQIGQSHYEVSTFGSVRNSNTMRILKPRAFKKLGDYICYEVNLDLDGLGQKNYKIHRLVAHAFITNPENRNEIDHIDRNPANNNVSNLRWSTRSEQSFNTRTRKDNSLGERNIIYQIDRKKRYRVEGRRFEKSKSFLTLEEAIAYRDSVLSNFPQ